MILLSRCLNLLPLLGIMTSCLLTACSHEEVLLSSVDIPYEWMPTDTIYIPLEVKENTDRMALLQKESGYAMSIYVRHSYMFPYKSLRLLMLAQYIDSNQDTYQVLEIPTSIQLVQESTMKSACNEQTRWKGSSWGSMISVESTLPNSIVFPYIGDYRLAIVPDYSSEEALVGIYSITIGITPR